LSVNLAAIQFGVGRCLLKSLFTLAALARNPC
jgi:hypothetical protein